MNLTQKIKEKSAALEDFNWENVGTASTVTYTFRRKAIALVGEAYVEKEVILPNTGFSLSSDVLTISKCVEVGTEKVIASPFVAGGNFSWSYNDQELTEGVSVEGKNSVYRISRGSFGVAGNNGFDGVIQIKYAIDECFDVGQISVSIEHNDMVCPSSVIDIQGNEYAVVRVGCQCWMKQNLRRTDVEHCPVGDPVVHPRVVSAGADAPGQGDAPLELGLGKDRPGGLKADDHFLPPTIRCW